jgi:hypothetical protein
LDVCSVPTEVPAAERARWLSELSEALNEAHRLLTSMALPRDCQAEARELYLRIEAARLEVQSLRLSRSLNPREQDDPERINSPPWEMGTAEEA